MVKKILNIFKRTFFSLFLLNSNYFAFLGGIFIATSVNFYTNVFGSDTRPKCIHIMLIAAILTLTSSFFWSLLSWTLQPLQSIYKSTPSDSLDESTWITIVSSKIIKLTVFFCIGLLTGLLGLIILIFK